mmetsp:Transcript_20921/g.21033  ORF Transcript_20921/g.21033 Transcript_20921/m.21033 type:complete len:449 (+) Transcript_20921:210-1556(+)|eukprot:CAMPEP_0182419524 /NCGR_PEP_ID=MMETSP1167-20130531/3960_1 /TAXON_ID=2988 /ORGANISM="Mallomonas Sp, Strain CCMP3275" /LENGTH=448 /DNA_ID=CAMNT_0024594493 /DNA_START=197 /DNA_END=1543 /DNA_ORIENTATION=+
MYCLSGPFVAAFGEACSYHKNDDVPAEVTETSTVVDADKGGSFKFLEMDDTLKQSSRTSVSHAEDKTDSETSGSSLNSRASKGMTKEVKCLKTIGSGRFGFVRIGYCNDVSNYVVLNSYQKSILSDTCQQHIPKREKDILEMLCHPFISKLVGSFQDSHSLYLMLNVARGGDLSRLLMTSNEISKKVRGKLQKAYNLKGPLTESQKMFYAACVVSVFKYAHSKNVLHRGLHPDTLFIDETGYLKIADWGFAKICDDHTFTLCGHVEYLCPEAILYDSGYGKGADYWALGVLIFEMLAGRSAFVVRSKGSDKSTPEKLPDDSTSSHSTSNFESGHGFDDASTVENIISAQIEFPSNFSSNACHLISGLCQKNPSVRLGCVKNSKGIRDIISHPWFAGMDWDALEAGKITPPWVPTLEDVHDFKYFGEGYAADDAPTVFDGYNYIEWNAF